LDFLIINKTNTASTNTKPAIIIKREAYENISFDLGAPTKTVAILTIYMIPVAAYNNAPRR
jgi:hypothetical protein